ncbi:hypothetical protein [Roseinatronobacter sp. NSM]|uniref:hypothetical protein n=1 Tax=Roseinatronobacter sp. NSM TaxID=3457785 RepID=UPI004036CF27
MSFITTPINPDPANQGGDSGEVKALKTLAIHDFYFGAAARADDPDLGATRERINPLLTAIGQSEIACGEYFVTAGPKLNLLNNINAALGAAVGANNAFVIDPETVFSDTAGTTPATFGGGIAAIRDTGGALFAVQDTPSARPAYGRHPASGLRNRLPNNRMDGAAVGVLGAGGALPTGWSLVNIATGEVEIVSLAPKSGRPNIRIRLNGTPTGNIQINFTPPASVSSATGQTWTGSAWVQQVGGSSANISGVALINTHFSTSGFLGATNGGSFLSTIESDLRRVASGGIAPESVTNTGGVLQLIHASGPIDITLDISAPQLEQASAPSAVQVTGANGFDVTEEGQRSVYYMRKDGVDDRLTLSAAFSGQTSYTLAAAHDVAFLPAAPNEGIIFGGTGRFTKTVSSGLRWRNESTDNQVDFSTQSVAGRQVDMVRVAGAAAPEAWRNGQAATINTTAGSFSPLVGLAHIGSAGTTYSAGRIYGGALIPAAITPTQRRIVERALAYASGVTL